MMPTRDGALRLFRFYGIDVYVHWSWFVAALYFIQRRVPLYTEPLWAMADYLILFFIIMLHEFGHAFACIQVGGRANYVVLSPLGGLAYVEPPHRPGASLWSTVGGPLVNVILVPILWGLTKWADSTEFYRTSLDGWRLIHLVFITNRALLIFTLLPIFPMDGGRILQELLWYRIGYRRSMVIATTIGLWGCGLMAAYGLWIDEMMLVILAAFLFMSCRMAWLQAKSDYY